MNDTVKVDQPKLVKQLAPEDVVYELSRQEAEAKYNEARHEFNQRRKVMVKQLPEGITAAEITGMFTGYDMSISQIESNGNNTTTVNITMDTTDNVRAVITRLNHQVYMARVLEVATPPIDSMLCVTNLPLSWERKDLYNLVYGLGRVERCFLMVNETTGLSNGYGFVEFATKEQARKAKPQINGHRTKSHAVRCDWADDNHKTWEKLGSTCLYVETASNFRDIQRFRQLMNRDEASRYCQLALTSEGKPRGFGIVAYETHMECLNSWRTLNGCILGGQPIQMSFVTPGHSGRNTYTRMMQKTANQQRPSQGDGLLQLQTQMMVTTPAAMDLPQQTIPFFPKWSQNPYMHPNPWQQPVYYPGDGQPMDTNSMSDPHVYTNASLAQTVPSLSDVYVGTPQPGNLLPGQVQTVDSGDCGLDPHTGQYTNGYFQMSPVEMQLFPAMMGIQQPQPISAILTPGGAVQPFLHPNVGHIADNKLCDWRTMHGVYNENLMASLSQRLVQQPVYPFLGDLQPKLDTSYGEQLYWPFVCRTNTQKRGPGEVAAIPGLKKKRN